MHPCVKVLVLGFAILGIISSTKVIFPLLLFCCALGGMLWIRLPVKCILARLAAPFLVVAVLVTLQTFLVGTTPIFSFSLMGYQINAMKEGLGKGILLGSRAFSAVSVLLLMSCSTPAHRIFLALRRMGVPASWVEVAMLMYRYTFIFLERTAEIMTAQKVRLGYSGVGRSLSSLGTLAGSVIVLSMEQAIRTHEAMILRGYRGAMPFGPMPPLSNRDKWIAGVALGVLVAAYSLIEWGLV